MIDFLQHLHPSIHMVLTHKLCRNPSAHNHPGFMSHQQAYTHKQRTHTHTQRAVSAQLGHESPSTGWKSWVTHEPINMCWQQSKALHCNYKR